MKSKLLFLLGLTLLCGTVAARAQVALTTWTAAGGAWTLASQPGYTPGTGGVITADAGSFGSPSLAITGATSGGLYTDYFYPLFSTPTFTLSLGTLADVSTVTLSIVTGGNAFQTAPALDFGDSLNLSAVPVTESAGTTDFGELTRYTYTWDVSSIAATSIMSVDWTLNIHSPVVEIALTQTSAVPEPAAYAALAGFGVLVIAAFRRRARAA